METIHASMTSATLNNSQLTYWFWTESFEKEKSPEELINSLSNHSFIINLEKKLNYQFNDRVRLIEALSHRSFVHEVTQLNTLSYEKAEFIGDSFINYFVSKKLFKNLSDLKEGQWSKLRGAIVNTNSLCIMSEFLGLESVLLTGRGDVTSKSSLKQKIYADLFEAVIGSIILDSGEENAWNVLDQLFEQFQKQKQINFWSEDLLQGFDYKSQLQEYTMQNFKSVPKYDGEAKGDGFLIQCYVNGELWGTLEHESKKKGQKELAKKILIERNIIKEEV